MEYYYPPGEMLLLTPKSMIGPSNLRMPSPMYNVPDKVLKLLV